jgi:hypothetical protein
MIENCVSTPCGHSFCRGCLDECLNLKKTCPTCTAPVDAKLVLANKHLERIMHVMQEHKDKAGKDHFAKLLGQATQPAAPNGAEVDPNATSIQSVFQKHLMKSLGAYEDYLKRLRSAAEASAAEATAEFEHQSAAVKKLGGAATELQSLKARHQERLAGIQAGFSSSERKLQAEYDDFLSRTLVNPTFLPIQVILCIESTGARYPFVLEPIHTLRDVKKYLLTKPASTNSPELITRISSKRNPFVIRSPFPQSDGSKSSHALPGSSKIAKGQESDVKIDQKHVPISQHFDIFPGSQIVMLGPPFIKVQTKECFKSTFSENDPDTHKCTFMKCNTCNRNWICKDCAQACHEGHQLVLHVAEQVWKTPCCYCTKTNKCTLYQKK